METKGLLELLGTPTNFGTPSNFQGLLPNRPAMRRIQRAVIVVAHTIGGTGLLLVLLVAAGWRPLIRSGVRLDLHNIAKQVRTSEISLADKERLLNRINHGSNRRMLSRQCWKVASALTRAV